MKVIVQHGFPLPSVVGKQASYAALIMVIHSDGDRQFQIDTLRKLDLLAKDKLVPSYYPWLLKTLRIDRKLPISPEAPGVEVATNSDMNSPSCYLNSYRHAFNQSLRYYVLNDSTMSDLH